MGGGLRVPIIMDFIKESVTGSRVNQMLNQDEAISFGAGFLAINYSNPSTDNTIYVPFQSPFDFGVKLIKNQEILATKTIIKRHDEYKEPITLNLSIDKDEKIELYETIENNEHIIEIIEIDTIERKDISLVFALSNFGTIELTKVFTRIAGETDVDIPLKFDILYTFPKRMTTEEIAERSEERRVGKECTS